MVDLEDLIDAGGIANLLGLSSRTAISTYQQRYPEMPRPVVILGRGRPLLWSREEIIAWARRVGRL